MITQKEIAEGWQLLFDGRFIGTLERVIEWKVCLLVEDGKQIRAIWLSKEEEGDLITKEQFENFELKLDFLLSDTANSGIFYFAQELEEEPIWHSAPEYQLLDNETYLNIQGAEIMEKTLVWRKL